MSTHANWKGVVAPQPEPAHHAAVTTEDIYDNQISPLMGQIIAICREHRIPMLASFTLKDTNDEELTCNTLMTGTEANIVKEAPERYREALSIITAGHDYPTTKLTVKDAAGKIASQTVIV